MPEPVKIYTAEEAEALDLTPPESITTPDCWIRGQYYWR